MKLIKFDLPINGTKVKNIEELRDNFSVEILNHFRTGLLAKWLRVRNMHTEISALTALEGLDEHSLLKQLCVIFMIEADDSVISAILNDPPEVASKKIINPLETPEKLTDLIDFSIYRAIRTNSINAPFKGKGMLSISKSNSYYETFYDNTGFKWQTKEKFNQGESILDNCGTNYLAPGTGKIINKKLINDIDRADFNHRIAGWFLISSNPKDYLETISDLRSILEQRIEILTLVIENISTTTIKNSIEYRIKILGEIVHLIFDAEKNIYNPDKLKSFGELINNKRFVSDKTTTSKAIDLTQLLSSEQMRLLYADEFFDKTEINSTPINSDTYLYSSDLLNKNI